jgi:hypothetical protein
LIASAARPGRPKRSLRASARERHGPVVAAPLIALGVRHTRIDCKARADDEWRGRRPARGLDHGDRPSARLASRRACNAGVDPV